MDVYIWKCKHYYNGKTSAYYFYIKIKIFVDFHICISVPLSHYYHILFIVQFESVKREEHEQIPGKEWKNSRSSPGKQFYFIVTFVLAKDISLLSFSDNF